VALKKPVDRIEREEGVTTQPIGIIGRKIFYNDFEKGCAPSTVGCRKRGGGQSWEGENGGTFIFQITGGRKEGL